MLEIQYTSFNWETYNVWLFYVCSFLKRILLYYLCLVCLRLRCVEKYVMIASGVAVGGPRALNLRYDHYRCGGGSQTRTRQEQTIGKCGELDNFECPHSLSQIQPCNPDCPHGGEIEGPGRCQCQPSWTGQCCHQGQIAVTATDN